MNNILVQRKFHILISKSPIIRITDSTEFTKEKNIRYKLS